MKKETTLARNISTADEKASYDASCKRLLANKCILAWIMKSCLEEYREYDVDEIAEKYIEGDPHIAQITVNQDEEPENENGPTIQGISTEDSTIQEGTITFDIRFLALAPVSGEYIRLILNIEAQNDFYPGYPLTKRGIYYCSRMISAQYGTEFTKSHYEKIKKVYSIWICMNPPKMRENTITRYTMREENLIGRVKEPLENYDLITLIMICLGDEKGENYSGILKLLEVLLSSEREPAEKKKILEKDFAIKMTKTLESEVSIMCNLSKGVEQRGIEKGIAKGITQGILTTIKKLMENMNWTAQKAMEAAGVPEEEREKYLKELEMK